MSENNRLFMRFTRGSTGLHCNALGIAVVSLTPKYHTPNSVILIRSLTLLLHYFHFPICKMGTTVAHTPRRPVVKHKEKGGSNTRACSKGKSQAPAD